MQSARSDITVALSYNRFTGSMEIILISDSVYDLDRLRYLQLLNLQKSECTEISAETHCTISEESLCLLLAIVSRSSQIEVVSTCRMKQRHR